MPVIQDEISLVKVKDGLSGETYYPHRAWKMADGTFTKIYPNENVLPISRFEKTASREFVNDSRWDLAPIFDKYGVGIEYTISFDLKSAVAGPIQVYSQNGSGTKYNIGTTVVQATIEYKRYRVTVIPQLQTGSTMTQALLAFYGVYDSGRIPSIKNVKVELGNLSTLDIPSPNENYSEAYPKYEGFYSDTNQVGSDNPDDYKPWKPFMGPQGKDGYTPIKNVDYFDGQPGQNGKSAYLWIRYSQNADGSGMTTDPANSKYTGYATTETNVAPTSPSAYRWQQTKGDPGIGIPGEPGPDGKTSYLHIKYSNDGGLTFTGNGGEDGGDYIGQYVDFTEADSTKPSDYTWSLAKGPKGDKGDSAPLISLSGATQAITIDKDGKITPASSFTVIGTAVNTSISNWTYSLNGGNFGSAVPTGVTRSGNTVTINPATATFNQLTIRAADATVRDEFTISRIKDGGDGTPGADAYTVFLTNESYTFAGSTEAALADSTTTEVVVYKGINKITPTSITVGTKPTGLTSSVSGSVVTFVAATTLVTKSGTIPLTITADGKTFTKQFAYAISFQGGKGEPGQNGVSVTGTQVQYVQTSGTTEPTTGWSNTRPTPVPGQWLWTRSRSILSNGTYGSWVTVPTFIGREAIVVSVTAPSNPTTGMLWQTPTDPNVQKWDGTKWVDWGISIDNIIADNFVAKDGKFEEIEGIKITGSEFQNPFTNEPINGGDGTTGSSASGLATLKGKLSFDGEIDTSHKFATEYGPVRLGGTVRLKTASATTDPALMWWLNPYGLTLMVDGVGGTLRYQDLLFYDDTLLSASSGFSQYATSGDNAPMVSRTGRNVRLSGAFKNNSELPINADMIMGVLPEWARPSRLVVQRQQASFNNGYLLTVKTDGTMSMSRHAAGASNVTVPAGSWLNIAVGYSAKDF